MRFRMNKIALEDSLLVWIGAIFLIIAVYAFIYVPGVLMMFGNKGLFLDSNQNILKSNSQNIEVINNFIGFLDSETLLDGREILVKDLVFGKPTEDNKKFLKFKELAEEFFEKNGIVVIYGSAWIRIYEKGEGINQELGDNRFVDYEVSFDKRETGYGYMQGSQAVGSCDPIDKNNILFFVFANDKKIALCLEGF